MDGLSKTLNLFIMLTVSVGIDLERNKSPVLIIIIRKSVNEIPISQDVQNEMPKTNAQSL